MQIADYEEGQLKDLLTRRAAETPGCHAMGAIDHMIPIRYTVDVGKESHLIEACIFITECDNCGACPEDEQSVLHGCVTCGERDALDDLSHGTDGLDMLKGHLQIEDRPEPSWE